MSRVTMTEAQFRMFDSHAPRVGSRKPAVRRPKGELPENILESQIKSYLEARGWTCTRQQVGTYTPYRVLIALEQKTMVLEQAKRNIVRIGEKGAADWLATWPWLADTRLHQLFYWEAKAPGKKPSPEQIVWLEARRRTGTTAEWFDGFDDGFKGDFLPWYLAVWGEGSAA